MKYSHIANGALTAIIQLKNDPELEAMESNITYDVCGEVTVYVRFVHAPKAEKKEKEPVSPAEPESAKTPEGEIITDLHLDGQKVGEAVCRLDPKLIDRIIQSGPNKYSIGGSTEAPEAGSVASVEEHRTRPEDGATGGERNESPESRARHHFDAGIDR